MNIPDHGLLTTLPILSPSKTGWPWTVQSPVLPERMPDGSEWPKISIVTPSFNQGRFIEETIRSVLLQNYPNLEYIIMDGGSTDESVEIIKKYEPWLTYWVSGKDEGQSDAINKGFAKASGIIGGWLNSDDSFYPEAMRRIADATIEYPNAVAWCGECNLVTPTGKVIRRVQPKTGNKDYFLEIGFGSPLMQPSCLFRLDTYKQVGGVDQSLHFIMDFELWVKLAAEGQFHVTLDILSAAKIYPGIKTDRDIPSRVLEHMIVAWKYEHKAGARKLLIEYSKQHTLNLALNQFLVLCLAWVYRRTFKPLVKLFE
jgi:glycosyltransferase involved in cell wall biosynthesis